MKKIAVASMAAFVLLATSLIFAPVRQAAAQAYNIISSEWIQNSMIDSTPIGSNAASTGKFTTLSAIGGITGNLTGNVTGNLSGNVNGTTGVFSGNVQAGSLSGPLTGNVTGNVTGALAGNSSTASALYSAPANCGSGATIYGISANGDALCNSAVTQSASVSGCSTGASSYDSCESTVTWATDFSDTNYQVACTAVNPTSSQTGCSGPAGCQMGTIAGVTKSTSGVTVIYATSGGNIATAGSFDCTARHN